MTTTTPDTPDLDLVWDALSNHGQAEAARFNPELLAAQLGLSLDRFTTACIALEDDHRIGFDVDGGAVRALIQTDPTVLWVNIGYASAVGLAKHSQDLKHALERVWRRQDLRRIRESNFEITCACGCGGHLLRFDARGRPRAYLPNHFRPRVRRRLTVVS